MSVDYSSRPGWAAAAPNGGDTAYRTQSLKFVPVEESLDESVPWRVLFQLWLRAAVVSVVVWMAFFFLFLILAISEFAASTNSPFDSSGSSGGASGVVVQLGGLISFVLFWVLLLLPTMEEPIAEWRTLLENKSAAADSAYAAVYGSLRRRQIPVNAAAMRVRSDVLSREVVCNRLVITDRSYVAYVSVFAYGTSLYVGWSMFRNRRGAVLIGIFIKDLIGTLFQRTGLISQMLRTERVRAMREAVHASVREGAEVAVQGIEVPIAATFGHDVPIQDLGGPNPTGAPLAAGWAPPPPPIPPGQARPGS